MGFEAFYSNRDAQEATLKENSKVAPVEGKISDRNGGELTVILARDGKLTANGKIWLDEQEKKPVKKSEGKSEKNEEKEPEDPAKLKSDTTKKGEEKLSKTQAYMALIDEESER